TTSLEIQANQVGLMKTIPASEYNLNRNFYTQFWVHESNYDKATLYFKRNNLTGTVANSWVEVQVNTLPCDKFGEWYLVEYKYAQTMQSTDEMLEFGIKSTNGVVYVDDVRLLPYESSM